MNKKKEIRERRKLIKDRENEIRKWRIQKGKEKA